MIDGFIIITDRAITALVIPAICQCSRQFEVFGDFNSCMAVVQHLKSLAMKVCVYVPRRRGYVTRLMTLVATQCISLGREGKRPASKGRST
jgi:hypothetical protein